MQNANIKVKNDNEKFKNVFIEKDISNNFTF